MMVVVMKKMKWEEGYIYMGGRRRATRRERGNTGGQGRGEEDRVRVALVGLQGWSGIREGLGRRGRG